MTEYEFHPIAAVFPLMGKAQIEWLAEDIKTKGLLLPIVLYEGKILDGRNRYLACKKANVEVRADVYEGDDPLGHSLSLNGDTRRHLNKSQLAMVATNIVNLQRGRPSEKASKEAFKPNPVSWQRAAAMVGVSKMTVQRAAGVKRLGSPNVVKAVEGGEVSVDVAYDAVKSAPKEKQSEWKPSDIRAAAKSARKPRGRVSLDDPARPRNRNKDAPPVAAMPAVARPNGYLMLCDFLLAEITDPEKIFHLRDCILSTWNDSLERAFEKALTKHGVTLNDPLGPIQNGAQTL